MNAHSKVAVEISPIEREISQIDDLIGALDKRRHWLRQASSIEGFRRRNPAHQAEKFKRIYTSCRDNADHYERDILEAAYRLLEIDAIHDKLMEMGS